MAAIKGSQDNRVMALALANVATRPNVSGEMPFAWWPGCVPGMTTRPARYRARA